MCEDGGSAGQRQQLAAQPENGARGHRVLETMRIAYGEHVRHHGFAPAERFNRGAGVRFGNVDDDVLDGFPTLAVTLRYDHLRLGDGQLVAFTPHRFDQDREMEFAAAPHFEGVGRSGLGNPQRDVRLQLAHQTLANLARGEKLSFSARKRRVVDAEEHRDRRFVHSHGVNSFGHVRVGDRIADIEVLDAGNADDIARGRLLDIDPFQASERQETCEPQSRRHRAVARDLGDRVVAPRAAAKDASDPDAPHVTVVVDCGNQ